VEGRGTEQAAVAAQEAAAARAAKAAKAAKAGARTQNKQKQSFGCWSVLKTGC
jgi:hypothetical protein